ncbi:MAG: energy transducer TonB, partial [Terracidiphilus sp.]
MASDKEHDVAILRATPNPFQGSSKVTYLTLSTEKPTRGDSVMSASLRPADIDNANSMQVPLQDFSRGQVLDYEFLREDGLPGSELLLFNQQVVPGQSGSPLVAADSHGVVGVVVGRWLHPVVIPSGANGSHLTLSPGAALRTYYAINLLDQLHVSWHMAAPAPPPQEQPSTQPRRGFSAPIPLSVEGVPYPPLALMGGDVLLDALVDTNGKLSDVKVVTADPPFLETVLTAVRTWSFLPARMNGRAVDSRIGIVFQFPQSYLPRVTSGERKYEEPLADSNDRGALPTFTVEPSYPPTSIAEGSVALYELTDPEGKITSTTVLRNVDSLTEATESALQQWQF